MVAERVVTLRKSRQREEVMRVLMSTTSHPTADWIYQQVRRNIPSVSLGTIYRNLRILRDAGQILELNFGGSLGRFDGRIDEHDHFFCENCGCIRDIERPVDMDVASLYIRQDEGRVYSCRVELLGVCNNCSHGCS